DNHITWRLVKPFLRAVGGEELAAAANPASAGTLPLAFASAHNAARGQIPEELLGGAGDLVDRALKRRFVVLRRLGHPADLPDILQRRGAHLFRSRRWLKVMKDADVAAHGCPSRAPITSPQTAPPRRALSRKLTARRTRRLQSAHRPQPARASPGH